MSSMKRSLTLTRAAALARSGRRRPRSPGRAFATALHDLPVSPIPFFPPFPSGYPFASSYPATPSRITLDHPLFSPREREPLPRDPISAALSFATDDDLVQAIVTTPRRTGSASTSVPAKESATSLALAPSPLDWTASIDPGLAFLALRSRPTFSTFLQCLHPHLEVVFARLRVSGVHQLLVSDLLLRHPDPRILRDLLEFDTASPQPDHLRSNLATSLFAHLVPTIERGSVAPLSLGANLRLKTLLLASPARESDAGLLNRLFADLYAITASTAVSRQLPPEAEHLWHLISILLHVLPSDPFTASSMFRRLLADGHIPPSVLGKSNPRHKAYRECLILSAVARCALQWKFFPRGRNVAESLLGVMEEHGPSTTGLDAVMECVRLAIVGKEEAQVDWAGRMLRRMAEAEPKAGAERWSKLPPGAIDMYLSAISLDSAADWYALLPVGTYDPLPARHIMRIADSRTVTPQLLARLSSDALGLASDDFKPISSAFIRTLAAHHLVDEIGTLHARFKPTLAAETVLASVQAAAHAGNKALACDLLEAFEHQAVTRARAVGKNTILPQDRLVLTEGYIIARTKALARRHFATLELADPAIRKMVLVVVERLGWESDLGGMAKDRGFAPEPELDAQVMREDFAIDPMVTDQGSEDDSLTAYAAGQ